MDAGNNGVLEIDLSTPNQASDLLFWEGVTSAVYNMCVEHAYYLSDARINFQ